MAAKEWPASWDALRAGVGCPKCVQGRVDDDGYGRRYYEGIYADAYLQRRAVTAGYTTVVFGGRHVSDLTDLDDAELAGYWGDVRTVARAILTVFEPVHLNYQVLGNEVPHLHTHLVARYRHDPAPLRPLPPEAWAEAPVVSEEMLAVRVARLRAAIDQGDDVA